MRATPHRSGRALPVHSQSVQPWPGSTRLGLGRRLPAGQVAEPVRSLAQRDPALAGSPCLLPASATAAVRRFAPTVPHPLSRFRHPGETAFAVDADSAPQLWIAPARTVVPSAAVSGRPVVPVSLSPTP